ncbi:transcription factor Opi1-domain-containing protein [Mycotypha africana]|uniref:transcription factor Opi1-domain-containing protein n=1 Tax=Mycotypha africana TaxID=64632 RepID=UPI0022FFFF5B|nr:transcription factor Opi1-domain-containing protein [Mycotypha africana]KAI8973372.1 transcription factor Opi1-domain-containing protein [Mycotypha africana]
MEANQQNISRHRHSIKPTSQHHLHHHYHSSSSPYPTSNTSSCSHSNAPINTTSRWQQLVVGAGSAAGTMSAVISEESMKCLKYCLSWLTYAIQHIEQQMNILRNFLVSLASSKQQQRQQGQQEQQQRVGSRATSIINSNGSNSSSVLSGVKKDIVETLRKVVDVITKYAGVSLPAHARQAVRGFILNLPGRWAMVKDIRSTTQTPVASPRLPPPNSPSTCSTSSRSSSFSSGMSSDNFYHLNDSGGGTTEYKQEEAAIRLLSFGQESVDMLNSVSLVFSDTVGRAELWIDRLKMVPGINIRGSEERQSMEGGTVQEQEQERIQLPPIRTLIDESREKNLGFPSPIQTPGKKLINVNNF